MHGWAHIYYINLLITVLMLPGKEDTFTTSLIYSVIIVAIGLKSNIP